MRNLAIVHFSPPELYPPLQNLLELLSERLQENEKVYVFTSRWNNAAFEKYSLKSSHIVIKRFGKSGNDMGRFSRYYNYIMHYASVFFWLIKLRPAKLLYFETLSSFSALLYKIFVNREVPLLVHYHEYTSPAEYAAASSLIRFFHQLEIKNYSRAQWVSHTNWHRMNLFIEDIKPAKIRMPHIFPNYPPASWKRHPKRLVKQQVRFLYIGACSTETMYIREFAEWIISQKGEAVWDIYAYNISSDAKACLMEFAPSGLVNLMPGVSYSQLPGVIEQYDIGVVLYRGHTANYIFNAPNKLFEYLACGLDVWYSKEMKGCYEYDEADSRPCVKRVDFGKMQHSILKDMLFKKDESNRKLEFDSVNASSEILMELTQN